MSITIEAITSKEAWDQAIAAIPEANFLQSWEWGVFQRALGKDVWRVGALEDDGSPRVLCAVVKETAKRGDYLAVAGGPLLDWSDAAAVDAIFAKLHQLGAAEDCSFIRFRPQARDDEKLRQTVAAHDAVEAQMHLTADLTLQLDLTQSLTDLLMDMRKNTRYDIRKAGRDGVRAVIEDDPAQIRAFYDHQLALAEKHGFVPFSYEFLHEQFLAFVEQGQVALIHTYHENDLLASAFVIFYNGEAVYHYGISTPKNYEYPGSHYGQWVAIQEAKRRGCRRYNFWGIAPKEAKEHRYAGVSTFKRGFGGEAVPYLPAHDIPLDLTYQATRGFEWVRKKLRNLD